MRNKKLKLSKFRELTGDNIVLSKYCGVPPAKRARLAKKTLNAAARGETSFVGVFSLVNESVKMQVGGRYLKYPEMSKRIQDYILTG